ncbi:MAG: hypothetical protein CENE_02160 [Candidatus Celerinatantimonas neptuna]|nr:MAG: hypothetical protein CENE_02160 [Candidatus Celerinatantimonas neptuna]
MGWKKHANVVQYGEAGWENYVSKSSNTSLQEAMRIAFANPDITFFFYCREHMVLDGSAAQYGPLESGDAVFFKGEPEYGSASQCDVYEKTAISTIYISPTDNKQFQDIGCYVSADGIPAIDVVCIFAGNYATDTVPMLRENNNPQAKHPFNQNIQNVLTSGLVNSLQAKGITVLLTVMNAHTQTGWSQFTDQSTAQNFVNYLNTDVISAFGLDGIDIDDEYSEGPAYDTSLPMVTTLMKETMPNKLITKALWNDGRVFKSNWNGHTLGANLSYGWQMSYYNGGANSRLKYYLGNGISKKQLCLGFSAEPKFSKEWKTIGPQASATISEGYGGGMMFDYENQPESITLMKAMVEGMNGADSWKEEPDCN